MAKHVQTGHMVRQLINRGRGEFVLRAQLFEQQGAKNHIAVIVNIGIAQITAHRITAVPGLYASKTLSHFIQCLRPGNLLPAGGGFFQRCAQAVRIVLQILQCGGLWADIAATEGVGFIALNGQNLFRCRIKFNFNAAGGLAQAAGAFMRLNRHDVVLAAVLTAE